MWPMAKAMVSTVSPKASATPANPMPTAGKPAASTAAPHPPNTSQNVPKNSAAARLLIGMASLLVWLRTKVALAQKRRGPKRITTDSKAEDAQTKAAPGTGPCSRDLGERQHRP